MATYSRKQGDNGIYYLVDQSGKPISDSALITNAINQYGGWDNIPVYQAGGSSGGSSNSDTGSFRQRRDNETLQDYLVAKSAWELSSGSTTTVTFPNNNGDGSGGDGNDNSNDTQDLIDYFEGILSGNDTERATLFAQALIDAEAEATPYWKEQIAIIRDELTRTMGDLSTNLALQETEFQRRIDRINEDLTYGAEQLTIAEQAELTRQKLAYENDILGIRDQMASRGLTDSSIRSRTEELENISNEDIVKSTTRKFADSQRNLRTSGQDDIAVINNQVTTLKAKTASDQLSAVRKVEGILGSANMTDWSSMLQGGLTGTLADEKRKDILVRANDRLLIPSLNTN